MLCSLALLGCIETFVSTYTVDYLANGADSGRVPLSQTKTQGVGLTLSENSNALAKTGSLFWGWNTAPDGSGNHYEETSLYTADANLVLYAEWKTEKPYGSTDYDADGAPADLSIPSVYTSITSYTFAGRTGLTRISIPSSVFAIGDYAFYFCSGLTGITIPNRVTSIASWTFAHCSGLENVSLPSRVTSIGASAFINCTKLASISLPTSMHDRIAKSKATHRISTLRRYTLYVFSICSSQWEKTGQGKPVRSG